MKDFVSFVCMWGSGVDRWRAGGSSQRAGQCPVSPALGTWSRQDYELSQVPLVRPDFLLKLYSPKHFLYSLAFTSLTGSLQAGKQGGKGFPQ